MGGAGGEFLPPLEAPQGAGPQVTGAAKTLRESREPSAPVTPRDQGGRFAQVRNADAGHSTSPASPIVTTSSGAHEPERASACRVAAAMPPQQGTSIFTTVTLFGAARRKTSSSFAA